MLEETYHRLLEADESFLWKFTVTYIFSNPRELWFDFVSKAYSKEAADRMTTFLVDEPELTTMSMTSVPDLLLCMDIQTWTHEGTNTSNDAPDLQQEGKIYEDNQDKQQEYKKQEIINDQNNMECRIRCCECKRSFKHGDSLRKHFKKKHRMKENMKWRDMVLE